MRSLIVTIAVLIAAPALAQVESRPTPSPLVTAENDGWYRAGQAIPYAGESYYPAGANVFFNANTMVRTGDFNGVPLYADTTLEPFSIVYVPIGRGLMQPYERPRRGDLAGTVGSRTPSFPQGSAPAIGVAATALPVPSTSAPPPVATTGIDAPAPVGTRGLASTPTPPLTTLLPPTTNDGIWISYDGARWVSSGPAVPLSSRGFTIVGDYAGFPVFSRHDGTEHDVIYVPTRDGLVAPYKWKP